MVFKDSSDRELFEAVKRIFPGVSLRKVEDNRNVLIHLLNKIQKILGGVPWKK